MCIAIIFITIWFGFFGEKIRDNGGGGSGGDD